MNTKANDTPTLVSMYVLTCNAALERHKDEFPYQQILAVCRKVLSEQRIGLEVYEEAKPESCCDYYTLRLHNGRLQLLDRGRVDPHTETRFSHEYLRRVAERSEEYIDDPSKLDVAGLKSQFIIE